MSTVEISKIDKNFMGEEIRYEGLTFYSVKDEKFSIHGLYNPYVEEGFIRMDTVPLTTVTFQLRLMITHSLRHRQVYQRVI